LTELGFWFYTEVFLGVKACEDETGIQPAFWRMFLSSSSPSGVDMLSDIKRCLLSAVCCLGMNHGRDSGQSQKTSLYMVTITASNHNFNFVHFMKNIYCVECYWTGYLNGNISDIPG
jgi:hypothetical protein